MRRLGAAFAALALCSSTPATESQTSQSPPGDQQPPIRSEANFVRVDVYPTKSGQPVQDLTAEDFEVLEDGAPQRVETFEHVLIHPAGPDAQKLEPSSQRESLQAAANPRNRVFVIFLDKPHVTIEGAYLLKEPVIRLLDRVLGPDDLVGVMTPEMSASNIVLGRKTQVIEDSLRRNWPWGERFRDQLDATESKYVACYPKLPCEGGRSLYSELALKMIERKRERATLEALQDVVRYLAAIREERKAILTVTEGWLLMGEDPSMMKLRECLRYQEPIPGVPAIGVSGEGKLTTEDRRDPHRASKYECDTDRMRLASMDNERFFRDIMDDANRANASFYPIDPRGLPAFDTPIGPEPPPPVATDAKMLAKRLDAMRTLADNTDGMAVVNNNDLDAGLRRIAADLTSYYLLGYYSTNSRLDGKFRRITVRVKRPGVEVRARRGYRAATVEEISAARRKVESSEAATRNGFDAAIGSLSRMRADARFRVNAAPGPVADGSRTVWVAGELQHPVGPEFELGGTAEIQVTAAAVSRTARVPLKPGERTFMTTVDVPAEASATLDVRARVVPEGDGIPLTDVMQIEAGADAVRTLLFRRGPSTGNRMVPAADFRFSRTERVRLEIPVAADVTAGEGRVLDKAGRPLRVPVTVGQGVDKTMGQRWITADINLSPLAAGDYVIELTTRGPAGERRALTAIRVVR
jgi:VWFA-related protein